MSLDFHFQAEIWSEKALKDVEIHTAELCQTKDGWLFIHLLWHGPVESKYVQENGYMFSTNEITVHLDFPSIKAPINDGDLVRPDHKARLDVGLTENQEEGLLGYDYKFIEQLKYGVNIYFAPKDALQWEKDLIVHDCTKDEEE